MSEREMGEIYYIYRTKVCLKENFIKNSQELMDELKKSSYWNLSEETLFDSICEQVKFIQNLEVIFQDIINNTWLDLFRVVATVNKEFFKKYFTENRDQYIRNLTPFIFYTMLSMNSCKLNDYFSYIEEDREEDKELLKNGLYRPSKSICYRNEFEVISEVYSEFSKEIFNYAKIEYQTIIENQNRNYLSRFSSLKTILGKIQFIERCICSEMIINGDVIDMSPVINRIQDIREILELCLKENNKFLVNTIKKKLLFIVATLNEKNENILNSLIETSCKYNTDLAMNLILELQLLKRKN